MIDVVNEQMIPFSKVPEWCEKNIGNRPHPVDRASVEGGKTLAVAIIHQSERRLMTLASRDPSRNIFSFQRLVVPPFRWPTDPDSV